MIRYFQGRDRHRYPREADEMFRLRACQFHDRLGWKVNVRQGWEIDEYDEMNPLYVVSLDQQSGAVKGSLRFLPTTGPTMMKGCFDKYFDIPFDVESPLIWECSRFSIEPTTVHGRVSGSALRRTTFELMHGGCEIALMAGVEQVLGIFDPLMLRVYRRTGWGPEIIASTDELGPNVVYFGIWDVSEASLRGIRERSGLTGSVLEDSTLPVKAVA
jgi:N-acyl-L-homoserine lactone synthetase